MECAGVAAGSKMLVGEEAKALAAGSRANHTRRAFPAREIILFPSSVVRIGYGLMETKTLVLRLQELSVSRAATVDTLVGLTIHHPCVKSSNNLRVSASGPTGTAAPMKREQTPCLNMDLLVSPLSVLSFQFRTALRIARVGRRQSTDEMLHRSLDSRNLYVSMNAARAAIPSRAFSRHRMVRRTVNEMAVAHWRLE